MKGNEPQTIVYVCTYKQSKQGLTGLADWQDTRGKKSESDRGGRIKSKPRAIKTKKVEAKLPGKLDMGCSMLDA